MSLNFKVSGVWEKTQPYVKVNGVWKQCSEVYINKKGSWKPVLYEPGSITFKPPHTYVFTVPIGVFSLKFVVYGGAGGGGCKTSKGGATKGGLGDIIRNDAYAVIPGQQFYIYPGAGGMGGHGRIASPPNAGYVAGGVGGTPTSSGGAGGNGGDATLIYNGPTQSSPLLCVSAGGGGGGGGGSDWGSQLGCRTTTLVTTLGTRKLTRGGDGQSSDDEGGCGGGGGGFPGGAGCTYKEIADAIGSNWNSKNGGGGGHGGQSYFANGQGWKISPYDAVSLSYTPANEDGVNGYVKITW